MLSLTNRDALRRAIRDSSTNTALRAVLTLRFEQMGGTAAEFHVANATDDLATAEEAVGWPMTMDDAPCWEWTERHPGGWTEIVFVLSDDGPAQVLLVPDGSPVADLLHSFAD